LGAAGLLALASSASAEAMSTANTEMSHQLFLGEEEISDVSLSTFHVFDKQNVGSLKSGVQLARGGGGCGGGCGGGGCRGLRRGLRRLRRGVRQGLWRRLQDRLRVWWLRWMWMRRMRSWLVGSCISWGGSNGAP
jgi:hypothetical protein